MFARLLGLTAWIYLEAFTVVLCGEISVVRAKRQCPRSLMTPFTDDVDLTEADQKAYSGQATAQRTKGFEHVEVSFDNDGQCASTRRSSSEEQQ